MRATNTTTANACVECLRVLNPQLPKKIVAVCLLVVLATFIQSHSLGEVYNLASQVADEYLSGVSRRAYEGWGLDL